MKFSLLTISTLAAVASASNFNLRASSVTRPSEFADASVSFSGIKQEPTSEDMEVIGESLIAAYNELFATKDKKALTFEPKSGAFVASEIVGLGCPKCAPDDDSFMVNAEDKKVFSAVVVGSVGLGLGCPKCAPDDDQAILIKEIVGPKCAPDDDQAITFEDAFNARVCHKLRTSVSGNFANVHNCVVLTNEVSLKNSIHGNEAKLLAKIASV